MAANLMCAMKKRADRDTVSVQTLGLIVWMRRNE